MYNAPQPAYDLIHKAFVDAGNDSPKDFLIDCLFLMLPNHIRCLGSSSSWENEEVKTYIYTVAKGVTDGSAY
ncbi:hypothetical protein Roomu2_00035 [Pseudomonas phage vB_PpuM-Roomu-2]|uniref:Uncharacterized protein n=1 Tax=Pseudomonas phage vB_PpuM-Roomu-2 TaxID=3132621 RepID=A0AAX4MY74_9CAUD